MLRTLRHIVFIRPGKSERAIRQAASGNSLLEKTSYDGTNQEAVRNSSDSLFDHKGRLPAADAGKVPAGLGERSSPKEEPAPDKGGTPPATPVRKNIQSVPQSVLKVRSNRSLHRHGMRLVEIYPRMRRSGTTRRIEGRPRLKALRQGGHGNEGRRQRRGMKAKTKTVSGTGANTKPNGHPAYSARPSGTGTTCRRSDRMLPTLTTPRCRSDSRFLLKRIGSSAPYTAPDYTGWYGSSVRTASDEPLLSITHSWSSISRKFRSR